MPAEDDKVVDLGVVQAPAADKSFLTLRARAARMGVGLYRIGEGYLVCWGATFRELDDLGQVEVLLQRMDGMR